jgi:hypothetical protein
MSEKYQVLSRSPLIKGGKSIKVPLLKGDLGGSTNVGYHTKKFSDILIG